MTTLRERQEEEQRRLDAALEALHRARRRDRSRRDLLAQALAELEPCDIEELTPLARSVFYARRLCGVGETLHAFRHLVLHLERNAPRLLEAEDGQGQNPYLPALVRVARERPRWLRPLADWRPSRRSPGGQFSQLLRHLLARYPVPAAMDTLFLREWEARVSPAWFHHVGTGGNMRTAPGLTVPLTKKMAHHFLQAPGQLNVVEALRWGEVLGLGGGAGLARTLLATWLSTGLRAPAEEEWLATLIRWFARHPMLALETVPLLLNYAVFRRRRDAAFEMPGRSPLALLRLAEEWRDAHLDRLPEAEGRLAAERRRLERRRNRETSFPASGVREGIWEVSRGAARKIWLVEEIRRQSDLLEEGREMRHCVGTYTETIRAGHCSVWSLQVLQVLKDEAPRRALTIELRGRRIDQARGRCNRLATEEERTVLRHWSEENGLQIDLWDELI
jgi:hypothetical protein